MRQNLRSGSLGSAVGAVIPLFISNGCGGAVTARPVTGPIAHEAPSAGLSECERRSWLEARGVVVDAESLEFVGSRHVGPYVENDFVILSSTVTGVGVTHPGADEVVAWSVLDFKRPKGAMMENVRSRGATSQILLWGGLALFTVSTVSTVAVVSDGVTTEEAVLGLGGMLAGLVMLGAAVAVLPPARDRLDAGYRELVLVQGEDDMASAMEAIGRHNAGLAALCARSRAFKPRLAYGSSGVSSEQGVAQ